MNVTHQRYKLRCSLFVLAVCTVLVSTVRAQISRSGDAAIELKIDSLLSVMTLDEKLGQLNQLAGRGEWSESGHGISDEQKEVVRKGHVGSFSNVVGAAATREVQRIAVEESRLGIPLMFAHDVIHGFRTIFPVPLAEASTWNPELIEQAARVAAREAAAAGLHWTFAPVVDIARDPRWGRIVEGSGEDPFLGSVMAAARVRGFQGNDLASSGSLLACAKHFAAYGGAEAGRDYNTVDISERTLREVYLPPFKAAVDAGASSLMSAFNEIGGIPSSANPLLLTKILREEWGFKGFVVSDWTAIKELMQHGLAATRAEAGVLAIGAGVDMDMESKIYVDDLAQMVRQKKLTEEVIDRSVRRVLRAKFKLGLFSDPFRNCNPELEKAVTLTREHRSLARKVAQQAIVLLKNEKNILPLKVDMSAIAVLGPLAESKADPLGAWAALGKSSDVVSVLEGIRSKVSGRTMVLYAKGCSIDSVDTTGFREARRAAAQADVVILVVGESSRMSGEASSRTNLDLPGAQEEFVREMKKTGKPVVVVLMNGRPLTIPWVYEHLPAIVESWFLGVETGNAIADVLFGDVSPSGKLPVTIPRSVGQIPLYYNHKNTGRPASAEDRFTSKYLDSPVTPQFPFGFGLSYTTFSYQDFRLSASKISLSDSLRVTVLVRNDGKREGDEVVQLYVRDMAASVTRPVKELKGIRRISLRPGEAKSAEFVLSPNQLGFIDKAIKWSVEPGEFKVFVGGNSVDVLEETFEIVRP